MCIVAIVIRSDGSTDFYPWAKKYLEGSNHALSTSFVNSNGFFWPFIVIMILLTAFFLLPLLLLVKTQWGNYFDGKTTMERFGRAGGVAADLE
jgi:hypothetical protein